VASTFVAYAPATAKSSRQKAGRHIAVDIRPAVLDSGGCAVTLPAAVTQEVRQARRWNQLAVAARRRAPPKK
jgi:hypothetical protein